MGRGFGVSDLSALTNRLRRVGDELDDAAVRVRRLCVGRHGILNPTTAGAVHVLWADWSGTVAEHATRCRRLAAAVAEASRGYRATDSSVAGYANRNDGQTVTAAGRTCAQTGPVDVVEGPLMVEPGEAFADMVATCHHLSIDIDTVAHTVAASPAAVDWWGSAADAAFAAIRDLSRDIRTTATAIDALGHVFAAYRDTVWPSTGVPISAVRPPGADPGRDLAEQAHDADARLLAGIAAWTAPDGADTATVDDEPFNGRRSIDSPRHVTVLTAAGTDGEPPTPTGSLMVAHRPVADAYRVVPGDTLWAIARRTLGDGRRWRDIFDLNQGHRQRDGRTLTDPRLILPGWRLQLPKTAGSTLVPRTAGAGMSPPAPSSAPTPQTPAATAPTAAPTPPPANSAAARPARSESVWPLVDVGIGAAALGAGVGWVTGRRRRRPGMTEGAAVRPTAPTSAESRAADAAPSGPPSIGRPLPPHRRGSGASTSPHDVPPQAVPEDPFTVGACR